jgi:hypothetical protein
MNKQRMLIVLAVMLCPLAATAQSPEVPSARVGTCTGSLRLDGLFNEAAQSKSIGTNSKRRWTFHALGDLFVISNHNVRDTADHWQLDSNQLLVKPQYAFRD